MGADCPAPRALPNMGNGRIPRREARSTSSATQRASSRSRLYRLERIDGRAGDPLDDGEHVRARITVIPDPDTVDGGWKVDEWKVLR